MIDTNDEFVKAKLESSEAYDNKISNINFSIVSDSLNYIRKQGVKTWGNMDMEVNKLSFDLNERKKEISNIETEIIRTTDIIADFEMLMAKKVHYDGYKKNPKDKIYMLMNGKDVDLYKESYERVDLFLKQFPHLKKFINLNKIGNKTISKLKKNVDKKEIERKTLIKNYNEVVDKYENLSKAKSNIDIYLERNKKPKKKLGWIESMKLLKKDNDEREREKPVKKKSRNEMEL